MKHLNKGFTLIEMMITVTIIGILSSIAYPSYISYINEAHRADAKAILMQSAQDMERVYTANNSYSSGTLSQSVSPVSGTALYNIVFATGQPTASTYTILASPITGSAAENDPCGTLSINQLGVKTVTGSASVSDCWNK